MERREAREDSAATSQPLSSLRAQIAGLRVSVAVLRLKSLALKAGFDPSQARHPKGSWAHLRPLAARHRPQAFAGRHPRPQEDTGGRRIAEDAAEKPATETAEARHRSQWRPTAGGPAGTAQAGTANAAAPPYRGEGCGSLRRAP